MNEREFVDNKANSKVIVIRSVVINVITWKLLR